MRSSHYVSSICLGSSNSSRGTWVARGPSANAILMLPAGLRETRAWFLIQESCVFYLHL